MNLEAAEQNIGVGIVQLVVGPKKNSRSCQNLINKARQNWQMLSATNHRINRDSRFVQISAP